MVYVWWVLGVLGYLLAGCFTYGALMSMWGHSWDDDDLDSIPALFGALAWPIVLLAAIVALVAYLIMVTLYLVAYAIGLVWIVKKVLDFGSRVF